MGFASLVDKDQRMDPLIKVIVDNLSTIVRLDEKDLEKVKKALYNISTAINSPSRKFLYQLIEVIEDRDVTGEIEIDRKLLKLTDRAKVLVETLNKYLTDEWINCIKLYELYCNECERLNVIPLTNRSFYNYLDTLEKKGEIESKRVSTPRGGVSKWVRRKSEKDVVDRIKVLRETLNKYLTDEWIKSLQLYELYCSECERLNIPPLSNGRFRYYLNIFEKNGEIESKIVSTPRAGVSKWVRRKLMEGNT